ncbi:MAG: hypothetical protein ACRDTA_25810 [Pseudonocardiaceae bacterium]
MSGARRSRRVALPWERSRFHIDVLESSVFDPDAPADELARSMGARQHPTRRPAQPGPGPFTSLLLRHATHRLNLTIAHQPGRSLAVPRPPRRPTHDYRHR